MAKSFDRIGQYTIIRELGRGGMGLVYLARDTKLDREVAIKVLPERTANDPQALSRFEREAKAVAALAHPNILAIHDFGRHEDVSYLVMELLEGESLRDRLRRSAVPWRKAVDVGIAIADGLAAAHAKGIIHRDLKPENIFLTSNGMVKILDFGLARKEHPSTSHSPTISLDTKPGAVLGTVGYMSPEQVRGRPLDARSDIFSLGCILHEMVAGARTFTGDTSADVATAILTQEPINVSASVSGVAPELDRTIVRCLEKNPQQRFQSSGDLGFTLRNILSGSGQARSFAGERSVRTRTLVIALGIAFLLVIAGFAYLRTDREEPAARADSITSLAVLPLENLSADPDQEYFADGMTEALITTLARISALQVTSPTSVWKYKGTHTQLPEIARDLNGVDVFVAGSVMRAGDRVRITVRLIEATRDRVLWSDSYDREMGDILEMQADVARAIAVEIRIEVTPADRELLAVAPRVNADAHDAYMRGLAFLRRGTKEACRTALRFFDRAIVIDPEFAPAHAGRAEVYQRLAGFHLPPRETQPQAKAAALDALALDERLAEAHVALGRYRLEYEWNWSGAEASFQRALELNPSLSDARLGYAEYLTVMNRGDEALTQLDLILRLDPAAPYTYQDFGLVPFMARRFDRGIRDCRAALEVDPEFWGAHLWLGYALAQIGEHSSAIEHLREAWRLNDESTLIAASLGGVLADAGQSREAREILNRLKASEDRNYICPYELATISIGLEEYDEAFEEMHNACDDRAVCMPWLQVDPRLDPIRSDPRFDEVLRCVGFEPPPRPTAAALDGKVRLAVLPFEGRSDDPDARYLADEIPASIIDSLTTLANLHVVPRSTAFRIKDRNEDVVSVARRLEADFVLTGQIIERGSELRIRAELVDVATRSQRWGRRYDRSLNNTAAVEEEITEQIVRALRIHVTGEEETRLLRRRPKSDAAHSAYLEGRFWWNKRAEPAIVKSIELYEEALRIDPQYALAYAGMADSYCVLGWAYRRPSDAFPKAREAAEQALAFDPGLGEAYPALGFVRVNYDWDLSGAEQAFGRAFELNPRYSHAHQWYALFLARTGRLEEVLRQARRAQELDPGSLMANWGVGVAHYNRREYAAAAEQLKRMLEMDPNFASAHRLLGLVYLRMKRYDDAIGIYHRLHELGGRVPANAGQLGLAYAVAGRRAEALEELRILEKLAKTRYVPPTAFALIHGGLGNMDEAFRWMDRAVEQRDHFLTLLSSPTFDELRGDPRFDRLIRRIGLEPDSNPTQVGVASVSKTKLAVLPFENVSSDPDTEYLSNEIPASIIGRLSRLSGLSVIPRNSAFRFDAAREDASSFAKKLAASFVLTGQLNARGTSLSIRAELIDVAENRELWSERYNRTLTDIMALEADITQSISQALRVELTPKDRTRLAKARTVDPEAHRSYLQGRFWWTKFTAVGYRKALFHFGQAIEKDPSYALAYAELANTYILMGGWLGDMPPGEAFPKAKEAAVKALEIDPTLADAHRSLASSQLCYDWDWQGAEQEFLRATRLDPDSATAHAQYGVLLHVLGKRDQAQAERTRALELDPLSPIIHSALGIGHAGVGEYEQAIMRCKEALRLDPSFPPAFQGLGLTYLSQGKHEDAIAAFRQAALGNRNSNALGWLGLAYARAGKRADALATLAELQEISTTGHGRVSAAMVHAALGNVERAFELLEIAYDERESGLVWLNTLLPFDTLNGDPRFDDLLRRIGFEPAAKPQSSIDPQ